MAFIERKGTVVRLTGYQALHFADLSIHGKGSVLPLGPSGSGKTTLRRSLARLEQPGMAEQSNMDDNAEQEMQYE